MSTRGIIGRPVGDGFVGKYHHFDSYPEGLGAALQLLREGFFHGDLDAMRKMLIDEHPAGWSTIVDCNFTQPAGFDSKNGPRCYCHGERAEEKQDFNSWSDNWCEWAYVIPDSGDISVYEKTDNVWRWRGTLPEVLDFMRKE